MFKRGQISRFVLIGLIISIFVLVLASSLMDKSSALEKITGFSVYCHIPGTRGLEDAFNKVSKGAVDSIAPTGTSITKTADWWTVPKEIATGGNVNRRVNDAGEAYLGYVETHFMRKGDLDRLQHQQMTTTEINQINAKFRAETGATYDLIETNAERTEIKIRAPASVGKLVGQENNVFFVYRTTQIVPGSAASEGFVSTSKYEHPNLAGTPPGGHSAFTPDGFSVEVPGIKWADLNPAERVAYRSQYDNMLNNLQTNGVYIKKEDLFSNVRVDPITGQVYIDNRLLLATKGKIMHGGSYDPQMLENNYGPMREFLEQTTPPKTEFYNNGQKVVQNVEPARQSGTEAGDVETVFVRNPKDPSQYQVAGARYTTVGPQGREIKEIVLSRTTADINGQPVPVIRMTDPKTGETAALITQKGGNTIIYSPDGRTIVKQLPGPYTNSFKPVGDYKIGQIVSAGDIDPRLVPKPPAAPLPPSGVRSGVDEQVAAQIKGDGPLDVGNFEY